MRDLPPVPIVSVVKPVHEIHVRTCGLTVEEVIVPCWLDQDDRVVIPQKLLFTADWICDLTDRKILKNKTGKAYLAPLGVTEVTRDWLHERLYVVRRVKRFEAYDFGVIDTTTTTP